jgi:hypothetical protein
MSDELAASRSYHRFDESTEKSVGDRGAETIRSASHRVSDAIEVGREPDMPLRHPEQARPRSAAGVARNRLSCRSPCCPPTVVPGQFSNSEGWGA